jgi:hypothetical protein
MSTLHPKLPPIGRFIRADEVTTARAFGLWADAGAITWPQAVIRGGSSL